MGKHFTVADLQAHQEKHHGGVKCTCSQMSQRMLPKGIHSRTCPLSLLSAEEVERATGAKLQPFQKTILEGAGAIRPEPKPRMNKTETEYARILEVGKRLGEIIEYRFEGISLSWGADPATGKPMWYTADFAVLVNCCVADSDRLTPQWHLHEVKGGHIFSRDLVRFKGCRAEWPMFKFEMHQKKAGEWRRIQ